MLMDYLYKNISSLKKIIFVSHQMPPQAVSHALEFIYTGRLNKRAGLHLTSLDQVSFSSFLHLPSLDQDFLIFLLNLFSHLFLHHASLDQVFFSHQMVLFPFPTFAGGQAVGAADPCRVPEQPEEQGGVPQR